MADQERINQGRAAKALLETPEFSSVLESVRRDLHLIWAGSSADQNDVREQAYYQQNGLNHVVNRLKVMVDTGRLEEAQLIREEAAQQELNARGN